MTGRRRGLIVGAVMFLAGSQAAEHASAQQKGADMEEGRKLFSVGAPPAPACALCHALKDAGATGAVGPDLDELRPDAERIEKAVRNGMGPMPAFKSLSDAQIQLLTRYVSKSVGTAP